MVFHVDKVSSHLFILPFLQKERLIRFHIPPPFNPFFFPHVQHKKPIIINDHFCRYEKDSDAV